MNWLQRIFSTNGFMPHGMCYEWDPRVIWLHVGADAVIALAYYSIPLTLLYFVRKRKDLSFDWMLVCFAIFIVACGTTHLMEILNIWHPVYWLSGLIKIVTALASIITAVLLIRLIPQALKIPSPAALQNEIAERTKALDRVASLNQELVAQTSNLAASNRELETFSYSVSHDLRAPLRHINGYIRLLVEETPALGEEGALYAAKIARSATHMGLLIDNLLAFSQTGKAVLQRERVDTAALVGQVRDELAPDAQGREIDWKIEALPSVFADKSLLKQVWLNLIGNAIKYTRERKPAVIVIGGRELPAEWEFYVRDNGAGFDMRHADKLFGVFQRLHSQDNFDGTGIGLANVHRIITRHGGRVWAEGQVDVGATFFFTLPRTPER